MFLQYLKVFQVQLRWFVYVITRAFDGVSWVYHVCFKSGSLSNPLYTGVLDPGNLALWGVFMNLSINVDPYVEYGGNY